MLTVHKLIFVEYFESVSTTISFSILRFFYLICMPNKCMIFEKSQICHRISIWMFQFTLNLLKILKCCGYGVITSDVDKTANNSCFLLPPFFI